MGALLTFAVLKVTRRILIESYSFKVLASRVARKPTSLCVWVCRLPLYARSRAVRAVLLRTRVTCVNKLSPLPEKREGGTEGGRQGGRERGREGGRE